VATASGGVHTKYQLPTKIFGWELEVAVKALAPLYFYTAVVLCLLVLTRAEALSFTTGSLLFALGILSWGLLEYGLHRFAFHYDARTEVGKKLVYAAHLAHHEDPRATNRIFSSLLLSAPLAGAYLLLARIVSASWRAAAFLFAGLALGYFYYEWLHFCAHHRRARLRLFRYLRKYHLMHHYKTPELRFGVTSPLFDVIFGTFRPVGSRNKRQLER
jgi:sterol desaturase/sphingolipid hydroxylase (fatty acid hydroxylase superfamily)